MRRKDETDQRVSLWILSCWLSDELSYNSGGCLRWLFRLPWMVLAADVLLSPLRLSTGLPRAIHRVLFHNLSTSTPVQVLSFCRIETVFDRPNLQLLSLRAPGSRIDILCDALPMLRSSLNPCYRSFNRPFHLRHWGAPGC